MPRRPRAFRGGRLPSAEDLAGTRAIAEITLRGIAAGRSALTLEPGELTGATVSSSQSMIDVK